MNSRVWNENKKANMDSVLKLNFIIRKNNICYFVCYCHHFVLKFASSNAYPRQLNIQKFFSH